MFTHRFLWIGSVEACTSFAQPLAPNHPSTSALSLDESEVYNDSDIPSDADSDAEGADDAEGDDKAEWVPQPGPAPPVPPDCHLLAKGVLNADVREVFHRLLADEVRLHIYTLNHIPLNQDTL